MKLAFACNKMGLFGLLMFFRFHQKFFYEPVYCTHIFEKFCGSFHNNLSLKEDREEKGGNLN